MSRLTFLLCLFELICSQVSANRATEAIIGGYYATKGSFKYQVALEYRGIQYCGGTIIDEHYILTSAHCVTDEKGKISIHKLRIVAGTNYLKETKDAITDAVETVYVHKEFNNHNYQNDIAILKLKNGLNLGSHSDKIEKISLATGYTDYSDVTALASGFGYQHIKFRKNGLGEWQEYGGSTDDKLKYAEVNLLSHFNCVKLYKPEVVFKTTICGQVRQHNKHNPEGVCTGDSGGPLVYKNQIIGILSKSPFACNESKWSAIYTRVSSYLHLIHNVVRGKPGSDVISANRPL